MADPLMNDFERLIVAMHAGWQVSDLALLEAYRRQGELMAEFQGPPPE